eukprot:1162002-Pelagomonas_calceolata.AAC.5
MHCVEQAILLSRAMQRLAFLHRTPYIPRSVLLVHRNTDHANCALFNVRGVEQAIFLSCSMQDRLAFLQNTSCNACVVLGAQQQTRHGKTKPDATHRAKRPSLVQNSGPVAWPNAKPAGMSQGCSKEAGCLQSGALSTAAAHRQQSAPLKRQGRTEGAACKEGAYSQARSYVTLT